MLEQLEYRRLLSSSVLNGVLSIVTDNLDNSVSVTESGGFIKVVETGQHTKTYASSVVTKIIGNLNGGNDTFTSSATKPTSVVGGAGNDTITTGSGGDTIRGGDGNDSLLGGSSGDALYGDAGNDVVRGDSGNDKCYGGDGNDQMLGGTGNDTINGGAGNDSVDYSMRKTPIKAELKFDTDSVLTATDQTTGSGGETSAGEIDQYVSIETIVGGTANDELQFTDWADVPKGTAVNHRILLDGGDGDDTLAVNGWRNEDVSTIATLQGGGGNDTLKNYFGCDLVYLGGAGNDSVQVLPSWLTNLKKVDTGTGTDTLTLDSDFDEDSVFDDYSYTMPINLENLVSDVVYQGGSAGITITITGNSANNKIDCKVWGSAVVRFKVDGKDGNDTINGQLQSDTLLGGAGDDVINGAAGDDSLDGGTGNDTIHGNAGNDTIIGGTGTDKLFGDVGNDRFYAADGLKDSLDGGSGTDKAQRDSIDVLTSIEGTL